MIDITDDSDDDELVFATEDKLQTILDTIDAVGAEGEDWFLERAEAYCRQHLSAMRQALD